MNGEIVAADLLALMARQRYAPRQEALCLFLSDAADSVEAEFREAYK